MSLHRRLQNDWRCRRKIRKRERIFPEGAGGQLNQNVTRKVSKRTVRLIYTFTSISAHKRYLKPQEHRRIVKESS